MGKDIAIRVVTPDDAAALVGIYEYYVLNTAITFEYDVPSVEEFRGRIVKTLAKYPYIAAEKDGELLGYAYTSAFVSRAAYDHSNETSIYVRSDLQKMGIGRRLYAALEDISRLQNIINMNACIGYPIVEDEYLTKNSAEFHAHLGYRMVGEFYKCGYKFGRWYNMVWMEKMLGEHPDVPGDLVPFPALSPEALRSVGVDA